MKNKAVVGIDPGAKGGMAIITFDNRVFLHSFSTKNAHFHANEMLMQLRKSLELHGRIEKIGGRRGDKDIQTVFLMGRGDGYARAFFKFNNIPFDEIQPYDWQLAHGLGRLNLEYGERKKRYKEYAQKLFPDEKITLGVADAILIAETKRRELII